MNIAALMKKSILSFQSLPAFASADCQTTSCESAPSESCAWEFVDESELASEMADALPNSFLNTPAPEVDPDDFEKVYQWFLS